MIAMSSAFNPFPGQRRPATTQDRGIRNERAVSSDGAIVTDRRPSTDASRSSSPGHGNADRIAEDKDHDLALLRIYGARGLKPIALVGGTAEKQPSISSASPIRKIRAAALR